MRTTPPALTRRGWCLALLIAAGPACAQSGGSDAAAKARFAVTLARFAQWPPGTFASDAAPLRLCVVQASPAVGLAFAQHAGDSVGGHAVAITENPPQTAECDVLFIDASAPRTAVVLPPVGSATLTLGTVDGFASRGGMVELANVNDQLRFDVNLKALRQARIGLSSQVLQLARQVRE